MSVHCTTENRMLTISVSGEVDHHRARELMNYLDRQIATTSPLQLTIDLSDVTFMDSSGIAILLRAHRRVGQLGGKMSVQNVPLQPAKVLLAAGLDRVLTFQPVRNE